jgi:hypothetical protein
MSPSSSEQGRIPWSAIIVALITLGTLLTQQPPLHGVRPEATERAHAPPTSSETIPARLWQDPFEAVDLHAGATARGAKAFEGRMLPEQSFGRLCTQPIHDRKSGARKDILAVMVSGGPFPEQAESRIRRRYAVLAGLSVEGYLPDDAEHIGQLVLSLRVDSDKKRDLVIPYECYSAQSDPEHGPSEPKRALILLWLRDDAFQAKPLLALSEVLEELNPPVAWQFRLLGPNSSTILAAIGREIHEAENAPETAGTLATTETPAGEEGEKPERATPDEDNEKCRGRSGDLGFCRRDTRILSFAATADNPNPTLHPGGVAEIAEKLLDRYGIRLERTIASDRDLARLLSGELILRAVSPRPKTDLPRSAPRAKGPGENHVVLIGEWDSLYARGLREDLRDELCGGSDPCKRKRVLEFAYLRGIDGKTVQPQTKATGNGPSGERSEKLAEPAKSNPPSIARPTGTGQYDYLRRLAQQLREKDQALRKAGDRIAAIGVVGHDVYDKLLALQALEPGLPGTLFFSTDLSADLSHIEQLRWSRNLVVASGFGLRLNGELQGGIPPFRSSYQTSAFLATRLAVGDRTLPEGTRPAPRVFEIGRYGPLQLEPAPEERMANTTDCLFHEKECKTAIHPQTPTPPILALNWTKLGSALAVVSLLVVIYLKPLRRPVRDVAATWLMFAALLLMVALLYGLISAITSGLEPVYLTAGVSVWPSEIIRLLALGFSVYYLYLCHVQVPSNLMDLQEKLCPPTKPASSARVHLVTHPRGNLLIRLRRKARRWRDLPRRLSLDRLKIRPNPKRKVPLARLWISYRHLASSRGLARWSRILIPAFIILGFVNGPLIQVFGFPTTPARGSAAFNWDLYILVPSVILLMVLIFSVLDIIRLTSVLIGQLARHRITWTEQALRSYLADRRLTDQDGEGLGDPCREWIGVQLVGELTAIIGKLVYLPFLVVFLMVASRLSFFDRWDFPPGLVIVIGLALVWSAAAALRLRRTAEDVRDLAVQRIDQHIGHVLHQETRIDAEADAGGRHILHAQEKQAGGHSDAAESIESEHLRHREDRLRYLRRRILEYRVGAFSSFLRQPLVQTLLLVVSGFIIYLVDLAGV